jgi:hypothetical protein
MKIFALIPIMLFTSCQSIIPQAYVNDLSAPYTHEYKVHSVNGKKTTRRSSKIATVVPYVVVPIGKNSITFQYSGNNPILLEKKFTVQRNMKANKIYRLKHKEGNYLLEEQP